MVTWAEAQLQSLEGSWDAASFQVSRRVPASRLHLEGTLAEETGHHRDGDT